MASDAAQWRAIGETLEDRAGEFLHPLPEPGEIGRRAFMGVLCALPAFLAAGCGQAPERIVPRAYDDAPDPPGVPRGYATALLRRGRAVGVVASCRDGRPIKLEGSPAHPASLGALDAPGQADLLTFYHPGRKTAFRREGRVSTREAFLAELRDRLAARRGGQGVAILMGPTTSPSVGVQLARVTAALPGVRLYAHNPLDVPEARIGERLAIGRDAELLHDFERADVVVSIGENFLSPSPSSIAAARQFAARRHPDGDGASMSRVYVAEPAPTITGASADHRLPASPRDLEALVLALAVRMGVLDGPAPQVPERSGAWVSAAASDMRRAAGRTLLLGGPTLPPQLHALVTLINSELGAAVRVIEPVEGATRSAEGLGALRRDLHDGAIDTLLIIDSNPAYTGSGEPGLLEGLARVPFVAHAGVLRDETSEAATWSLPLAHPLESWGDARAFDGSLTLLQPTIRPLYAGWTPPQLLGALIDPIVPDAYALLRAHYGGARSPEGFDRWWRQTLHDGVAADSAFAGAPLNVERKRVTEAVERWRAQRTIEPAGMTLVVRPDPTVGAGEWTHNQWLQELPKPITKLVWSNALEVAPRDAERLGLREGEVVEVRRGARAVRAPVWITPGHAESSVSLTLGYGRRGGAIPPDSTGVDAYPLRGDGAPWTVGEVELVRTRERARLVTTQHHARMQGVEAVRTRTLGEGHGEAEERRVPLTLYPEHPSPGRQWGMSIDLTSCIGCGACTLACQAENNIPWVGVEEVHKGREMHWVRVDRYYRGPAHDPEIMHQPVPCMHCEKAPCEVVCPVGATQHSHDGLNEMVYNRCIGTRYCSNNCPYKVRRFNFHAYASTREESLRLMQNPEVTVRARGVMEKCTYCVQRVRNGELRARIADRDLGDGDIVTACQQACPTRAIVFGDIADPGSLVSRARALPRRYDLLGELGTRPRTTYLALVRNPSPELSAQRERGVHA